LKISEIHISSGNFIFIRAKLGFSKFIFKY
jgi:hypothetical protein